MIQTAEGNLNETHSILQRMRELADQAANDTNVSVDRDEIQKEINALTTEINRIGNTTEFNTQNLLDGGASASGVSLSSTEAKGVAAQGGKIVNLTAVDLGSTTIAAAAGTLTFEVEDASASGATVSFEISAEAFETLWDQTDAGKAGSAATDAMRRDALEEVLGKITSATTFEMADGTERKVTLSEVATIDVNDSGIFSIQSKIGGGDITLIAASFMDILGAATSTDIAGVGTDAEEATLYGSLAMASTYELNSDDWAGKTFTVTYNGTTANITLATDIGNATTGKIAAASLADVFNDAFSAVFGADAPVAAVTTNPNNINDTNTYFQFTTDTTGDDVTNGTVPEFSIKGANLDQILGDFVPGQSGSGGTFRATFQIGANQGQSMTIEIKDMRSLALGISGTAAGLEHTDVEGARFTEVQNVTNGTTSTTVEYALDVSSHESASAAVKVINNAIENVSGMRSELGAYQNRLEHTINNLGTSSENLTAAESRIRDVDMAKEMMEFTKMNILSQAAQAMLAQANQQPQNVLQLLR